ncbi:MAG: CPBP family intramembrane metalloprotease [Kiritimatiellae bacterium]|nr:CPBP family intramembrane metalloprotease [Kiritimatiellia bacterium]
MAGEIKKRTRMGLGAELALIFVVWPLVAALLPDFSRIYLFVPIFAYSAVVFFLSRPPRLQPEWTWRVPALRLLAATPFLLALTWLLVPQLWFAFPRQHPGWWAVVMALYPFLSAWPQEFVYRRFFFWRYTAILGRGAMRLVVNALVFGWLHLIFWNAPALILGSIGGWIFARTFERSRNLTLVWIEHALYGMIAFTIGLGRFFYNGN